VATFFIKLNCIVTIDGIEDCLLGIREYLASELEWRRTMMMSFSFKMYVEVLKVTVRRILSFFFVVMTMAVHQSMGVPTGTGSMMPQSTSSSKLFLTASVR